MIQRIQSIFLFIGGSALISAVFLPFWKKVVENDVVELTAFHLEYLQNGEVVKESTTVYLAVLCLLGAVLAFGSLFSYKNRILQMKLNFANSILMVATLITIMYQSMFNASDWFKPENMGEMSYGIYALVVAMFMNILSNKFIRKDEQLVRSVDRIR